MLRPVALLCLASLCLFGGCAVEKKPAPPIGEKVLRDFTFEGIKLGDKPAALKRFADVGTVPAVMTRDSRIVVREIPNPNPHISMAAAYFFEDRLYKLELRYYDGDGSQTLSQAGGWQGLRDYLLKKFGPPTQSGTAAPLGTDHGLSVAHAKANMQWLYPKIARRLNYTAMADEKGGIAVVTFTDLNALNRLQYPYGTAPASDASTPGRVAPAPVTSGGPGF